MSSPRLAQYIAVIASSLKQRLPDILLVILVIFVPFRELAELYFGSHAKLAADLLVLLFALSTLLRMNYRIIFSWIDVAFLSLLFIAILSLAINGSDSYSAIIYLRGFTIFYILYFTLRNSRKRPNLKLLLRTLLYTLVSLMVFLVGSAVVEVLTSKQLLFPQQWVGDISRHNISRAYSFLGNPNIFAAYLLLSVLLLKSCCKFLGKALPPFIYAVAALGIVISLSRSAILATIIALVLLFGPRIIQKYYHPLSRKEKRTTLITTGSVALLTVLSLIIIPPIIGGDYGENRLLDALNGNEVRNSQIDGRMYIINVALDTYNENGNYLLGIGAGMLNNQTDAKNMYGLDPGFTSDNQFIKIFVELGILGFATFLVFIALLIKRYYKDSIALVAIILMLFLGMFYNTFEIQSITLLFWLILGLNELTRSTTMKTKSA